MLRLSDYLAAVDLVIKETFAHSVWIKAEIRNLSSKGGHYYFELAEKDDKGKVVASCRGTLWKFKATRLLTKFERATGMALTKDLTVLLKVNASFHAQYGFSLNITDIDPSYTLGDLARQYSVMLERLSNEGLLELNKRVPAPFDIENVLVIAPEKAAGLGDFRADADKLAKAGACQFHYYHATFQGNHAPREIRHAISKGMLTFKQDYDRLPDVLVIIRGGGAVDDLAYLNDYELAALIAEQPIPVWVGIGHERDNVILDEVAHTSFDTPSKVIAGIISHLSTLMRRTKGFVDIIQHQSQRQLNVAHLQSERLFNNIKNQSRHDLQHCQHLSIRHFDTIKQLAKFQLHEVAGNIQGYLQTIEQQSKTQLNQVQSEVNYYYQATQRNSKKLLIETEKQLRHYQQLIFIQHPSRQLDQGYALIKDKKGLYISSVTKINKGNFIHIALQDGEVTAVAIEIKSSTDSTIEINTKSEN